MALTGTRFGDQTLLQWLFMNITPPSHLVFHLYQNNYTPTYDDTPSNYVECAFSGYAAAPLVYSGWGFFAADPWSYAGYGTSLSWVAGGPGTIYGYWVSDPLNSWVFWAERLTGAPFTLAAGQSFFIQPIIGLQ